MEEDFEFAVPAQEIKLGDDQGPIGKPALDIREFKCEIIVLGLRDLKSSGLLPIRKAFIRFNLKALLPGPQAKAVENIQTSPKYSGPNPNIRTTIQF